MPDADSLQMESGTLKLSGLLEAVCFITEYHLLTGGLPVTGNDGGQFSEFWVMAVPVAVCIRTISSMMPCMVASSGMICRVTG